MTNLPGKIEQTVGDLYGWRTWIEYGFKQAKDELGWADYQVTDYHAIERWWELVMSVATRAALESPAFTGPDPATASSPLLVHPHWDGGPGWKRTLNNLRLPLPHLQAGLADLCALMNTFHPVFPT